jgi:hypothetical protein
MPLDSVTELCDCRIMFHNLGMGLRVPSRNLALCTTCMLFAMGCASGPPVDQMHPVDVAVTEQDFENPVLIAPGQNDAFSYADVFERVLSVVGDYFEIAYPNRYDGRIVTIPKIAPGYEQPWKPGTPNVHERLVNTFQTMRYRCNVQIKASAGGGYLVQVIVLKELKDDPQPSLPNAGLASFQESATVERQYEVLDPNTSTQSGERWIPKGRDYALEKIILRKIQRVQ